ncbi:uncharacterized protein F4807DRAFT_224045 [Annulohypoxylon truncatum]|uniref:uncharacterized protein n=1 Tax=Annulohypoxylon truncatum TaxID=327061 RepID=UPI002007F492|nr:uncharacterized protein F4807DRAFT_224045 [Annulohypoxylon truncatum]KAI1206545.1 hypothetical protein F4807DRAFT_224045 [Annulohypoxylon truncatum]
MDISPSKRRALEPIDSNARNPGCLEHGTSKSTVSPDALNQLDCGAAKRPVDVPETTNQPQEYLLDQPAKRQRVSAGEDAEVITTQEQGKKVDSGDNYDYKSEVDNGNGNGNGNDNTNDDDINDRDLYVENRRPESPDEVSMFDNSVIDTSQATTTITEPDAEVGVRSPPISPRRLPSMSREEARQKAEKLRLRLGLASYKVRTGQTDVPLDKLKVKPLMDASRSRQLEYPSLPPIPRREDVAAENEDNGEEHRYR